MRKYYGKLPDVIQAKFQKEYNSAVRREAEYMIVAVEIIDYKGSNKTTLFEEETNESLYKV